jgi:drug/metabolite transporter (DMT)-like permease
MAILLSLLSSLVWGTSDFAGGLLSKRRPAMVVVGWNATFGLLMVTLAVATVGDGWHGPYGWIPWGMAAGASGSLGLVCYYFALATGTMGVVAPVTSLGVSVPVVVGILSGESPTRASLAGIALAVVGVVLASGPDFGRVAAYTRAVLIAVLAGLFFGGFFVFASEGADDSPLLTLWAMRATVTTAFVLVALGRRTTGGLVGRDYLWLVGIAGGDIGANLLFAIASTKGYVSITSVLSSLFPVVTVLLARLVLAERLRRIQIAGAVVTMLGVALISSS